MTHSIEYVDDLNRQLKELDAKNKRLTELLRPMLTMAMEVLYNSNIKPGQTIYQYNKAAITYDDLRAVAKELLTDFEEPVGK